jgi:hypothetical protein
VTSPEETAGKQQLWKALSEAGLVGIELDDFPERIRNVKQVVMVRLSELLVGETNWRERESAAYSLGTLKKLETKLQAKSVVADEDE